MTAQTPPPSPDASKTFRSLNLNVAGPIAEVVLTGPGKGNAMGPDLWRDLPEAFALLEKRDDVRVVLLYGSGGNFSYGLDLMAMAGELAPLLQPSADAGAREALRKRIGELQRAIQAVADCRVPVVAAIAGWCIGGGLDLAAACDIRLASANARLSLREVKVGMVADLGSLQRLPTLIGQAATRELAYTGKDIDAERALRIGLVSDIFADEATLLTEARRMAQEIANQSPLVIRGIKTILNEGVEPAIQAGLRTVALWNSGFLPSHDVMEAVAAFAERRPPQFKGK